MKQVCRKAFRNTPFWLTIVFLLVSLIANIGEGQQSKMPRGYNPKINIGEFPPDFELPRLVIETDETGKSQGVISETDTVKLSSFRGKKPVCMIMSSYT
ncbi:MAG: hypothetical protein H8D56_12635 [Planctomycetes bacterium]|nr:hypothetical protein [Planctomycetota bacterium]MBL7143833.1 hypothetical protein [Phycisphaerae bacterium]